MKYIFFIFHIFLISCSNDAYIWNFLVNKGLTKEGTAGVMGNLKAESNLESVKYQTSYRKKVGLSDQEYVNRVNDGRYSASKFINDAVGFGLAQWTYKTRKQALLNYCRGKIGDLNCQLNFLVYEIGQYGGLNNLLRSSHNIRECTLKVLFSYEQPADQGSGAQNKRIGFANNIYNSFANSGYVPTPKPKQNPNPIIFPIPTQKSEPTPSQTPLEFTYAVRTTKGGILPEVTNTRDYAGSRGYPITDIAIKVNRGSIKYRVHVKGGDWLGYVTGYNWNDYRNGYAGNHNPIDLIQIIYNGNNELPKYRVSPVKANYYSWQYGVKVGGGFDGFAGVRGKAIDRIQISSSI